MSRKTEKVWKTQKLCLDWEEHRPSRIYILKVLKSCFKCLHYGYFWQISGEFFLVIKLKIPRWWHSGTCAISQKSGLPLKQMRTKSKIKKIALSQRVGQLVHSVVTPRTAACQGSTPITNSQSLLKLMSIESVMPSNHLILCHSLLLPPSVFPSIRVFSKESVLCIRWPKYWSFSFNNQSFQWIFRTDFL